ncbi:uncharacterized protein LOC125228654 [Leguminivora glycinivorella]|uniref:uncharacterized protein LOC125228654 n=1 Tax=Leguminivora glycinivorella TaxID=1035111 RepID=UPI00200CE997|nr:uncharacterized protein LOC125228654 [Leguminivora glycinivorella]
MAPKKQGTKRDAAKKDAKKEDPEEQMRKKFRAKCQFRALGRLVLENRYWLIEGVDEYEGLDDVKRRVEQAVRGKHKKKQLLNINDKALLNKPAEERTLLEQQYLYRILGGLKCFKRYPNHVKKKLAAATYFKYYGPNRVIVRQHHVAHAMYFVVTGDVTVSQLVYDELLQQHVSVDVGTMAAGDMFGEVSLLHNIPRTATVTTNGHCELLALMKEDFKNVLQESVQKQWEEVRRAMSAFTYFDALDEVARREGCIVAKMKSYGRNETLLGDGVGVANFVYFVLSGRCQMIESLQVIVTQHLGRSHYTLYDPYVHEEESEKDLEEKWFAAYKNRRRSTYDDSSEFEEAVSQYRPKRKSAIDSKSEMIVKNIVMLTPVDFMLLPKVWLLQRSTANIWTRIQHYLEKKVTYLLTTVVKSIVALTPVDFMLLPKVWLLQLQRSTANIWTRIQHYLEKKVIPTKKKLFKEFVTARRWRDFRDQVVSDVVARSNAVNFTSVHDLDPEEQMRRKFRAKCQFKALGRLVLANRYWLIEGVDEYKGVDDVKRRVTQVIRTKQLKKRLLDIQDKALLNKPAEERTHQEQQYLYRKLGDLKCFKRYPKNVRRKLAAATYFRYYGPNRVIVRQYHEAHAMYFIVNGDVTLSQLFYDDLLQQYVSVDMDTMTAGDMFGDVSLLHNTPRTSTVTTNGHCELLALLKEDFKHVLQALVQKQWDEVKRAMSAFTYFDGLDEMTRREGCITAKMKSYATNETLLGDGEGVANFVYFILSGRCQMIESLQVIVRTHLGRNHYTLHDPYVPQQEQELSLEKKWFGNKDPTPSTTKSVTITEDDTSTSQQETKLHGVLKKRSQRRESDSKLGWSQTVTEVIDDDDDDEQATSNMVLKPPSEILQRTSVRLSDPIPIPEVQIPEAKTAPLNLRTYFMQVVIFNPGSTFGFGENMRDRRIVALTPVDCMLLPKVWLLQRNTANIWTRIQHYLEKKIPTKKQLFKEFVSSRRWQEYRDQVVSDVVARSNAVNFTTVHDVPYSIRMEEMLDI